MNDRKALIGWGGMALFVIWLFYAASAYYVVQKPFSPVVIASLSAETGSWLRFSFSGTAVLRTLLDLGTALWLTLIALGLGLWISGWLALSPLTKLEEALYGLGLGFGILGLLTLLLGLAGWLETAVFYAVVILGTLLALPKLLSFVKDLRPSLPKSRLITLYLAIVLALGLALALLPPTSWDGLFYHLKGPKLYLAAGQIQPGIDIPHLNFPSLFEMLFMLAMVVRGDVAAKLIHYVFALMLGGLVYAITRRHLGVKNGWTAVVFLYAIPMILTLGSWAYNDLALGFYQVIALHTILYWQRVENRNWLILSGVFCGLSMGLKYTSFITPLFLAGLVIWQYRTRWRAALRPLLLLTVVTTLIAAPWYIKNLFFTRNPVYPFVFNGRFWDDFRSAAYAGTGTGIGLDPIALLRLPHDLMLGLQDASQDVSTGPLLLMFLPLLFIYGLSRWGKRAPSAMHVLLIFALVEYLIWMMGVVSSAGLWQSRLLLPAFVALCPVLAWILADLQRFDHPQFSLHRFVSLTIAVAVTLGLVGQMLTWLPRSPWAYIFGTDTRDEILLRDLGIHYLALTEMNGNLSPDAIVTFLWEPRSYYCDIDCRPDSILDKYPHLEHLHGTAPALADIWRDEGVTHVLLFESGLDFILETPTEGITPEDTAVLQALLTEEGRLVTNWHDAYSLYELTKK